MSWETQLIYASIESTRPLLMVWWVWKWCGSCAKAIAVTRSLPKMYTNTDWHAAQASSSSSSSLLSPAFKQRRAENLLFFSPLWFVYANGRRHFVHAADESTEKVFYCLVFVVESIGYHRHQPVSWGNPETCCTVSILWTFITLFACCFGCCV